MIDTESKPETAHSLLSGPWSIDQKPLSHMTTKPDPILSPGQYTSDTFYL